VSKVCIGREDWRKGTNVDVGCLSFDNGYLAGFVTGNVSCRLDNGSWVEGADSYTWEERGEQEEVLGADDNLEYGYRAISPPSSEVVTASRRGTYNIVVRSVDSFEQAGCTPSTTEDDDRLLFGVKWQLRAGVSLTLCDVVETSGAEDDSDKGCATKNLKEIAPSRLAGWWGWGCGGWNLMVDYMVNFSIPCANCDTYSGGGRREGFGGLRHESTLGDISGYLRMSRGSGLVNKPGQRCYEIKRS
jgi:hypothetical protein